jgi:hypothetical protein
MRTRVPPSVPLELLLLDAPPVPLELVVVPPPVPLELLLDAPPVPLELLLLDAPPVPLELLLLLDAPPVLLELVVVLLLLDAPPAPPTGGFVHVLVDCPLSGARGLRDSDASHAAQARGRSTIQRREVEESTIGLYTARGTLTIQLFSSASCARARSGVVPSCAKIAIARVR